MLFLLLLWLRYMLLWLRYLGLFRESSLMVCRKEGTSRNTHRTEVKHIEHILQRQIQTTTRPSTREGSLETSCMMWLIKPSLNPKQSRNEEILIHLTGACPFEFNTFPICHEEQRNSIAVPITQTCLASHNNTGKEIRPTGAEPTN